MTDRDLQLPTLDLLHQTRTRLAGRGRWLEPGQEALVPKSAVRHGEWSKPAKALGERGGSDG